MSLVTLVHYAQTSFGDVPWKSTITDASETLAPRAPGPAPPIPDWLRTRRPEEEVPVGGDHTWRIHGAIPPPLPLPDVDRVGPDALAFYVPFHLYREDWGVYIRDAGVKYLACILKGGALGPGDERYLDSAEAILRHHEMWHAATEVACTRAEILARRSLYREYFDNAGARLHEEAVANAHAVRWGPANGTPERRRLEEWMSRLGPGYRDFAKWIPPRSFSRAQDTACRSMTTSLPRPGPRAAGAPHQFLYRGSISYPSMPVRRIVNPNANDASLVRPFAREFGLQIFVYSNDHEPAHFHIRKLSNNDETRYLWPSLTPYEGDFRLTGGDAKKFQQYWSAHARGIVSRLEAVYGRRGG